jgi:hypothetical protein
MISGQNRRSFLAHATGATFGAAMAFAGRPNERILGANDRVVVGVIGYGEMGTENMSSFMKHPGVEIGAVCDVYQPRLEKGVQDAGGRAKAYNDFRQVLDDKDIDIVIVATADNWHALHMVMACQAGKDVYVEKPISTTLEEGKAMVEAARKYKHRLSFPRSFDVGRGEAAFDSGQPAGSKITGPRISGSLDVNSLVPIQNC